MQGVFGFYNNHHVLAFHNRCRDFSCSAHETLLNDCAIVLDIPQLRTGSAIILKRIRVDVSTSLALMKSVSAIPWSSQSTSMTSVAGGSARVTIGDIV